MPANKHALIRYKTIDQCLQNRGRKWTLEDLLEACNEALYEFEGIENGVSKRSLQLDLQNMRSEKLGYNAPIVVVDKKYYTYEDKKYSIFKQPINRQDLSKISEALAVLSQFKSFHFFEDMSALVSKLENNLMVQMGKEKQVIELETNEQLKGLHYVHELYEHILQENPLLIHYKAFTSTRTQSFLVNPYLLKEFRNRWFVLVGKGAKNHLQVLALDRIERIEIAENVAFTRCKSDVSSYFTNCIGVSKSEGAKTTKVLLSFDKQIAPYVLTKPIHNSQRVIKNGGSFLLISIDVVQNLELEREIISFAEMVRVVSPKQLAKRIEFRLAKAREGYDKSFKEVWDKDVV